MTSKIQVSLYLAKIVLCSGLSKYAQRTRKMEAQDPKNGGPEKWRPMEAPAH